MALNISSRPDRHCFVLTVAGNLTLGPHLKKLQQTARAVLEGGPPGPSQGSSAASSPEGLILDVSGLRYTDSAGLGELTIVYTLCARKQCILVLTGVPAQLKQMLELTRLDALLPSVADLDAAKRQVKLQQQKLRGTLEADAVAGE